MSALPRQTLHHPPRHRSRESREIFDVFALRDDGHRTGGVHLNPDALSQQACLILICEGLLEGEEGAFVAVVVYPAADNVDLVDLRLTYNTGWVTQFSGHCQQFAGGQFHRIWLVRDRAL